ncbi:hypothetical protein PHLGIDRAFT_123328 [Phlebiopsis gigantea 11061_1 CR5-6]|uniref:Uncharacterized protein n=1 Tax=Phlebiopsis gigantea (strain 11061_1 CR5-6) TaxID=745531 RepID=A0A0C3RYU6_PHLG1|nr:hypothetical protein PHLGIDRAFT_123328 [Phlebiopsis gigantea 11061_1 CR5-6]
MTKPKDVPGTRGRKTWAQGRRGRFMQSRKTIWDDAQVGGWTKRFYTVLTIEYMARFGPLKGSLESTTADDDTEDDDENYDNVPVGLYTGEDPVGLRGESTKPDESEDYKKTRQKLMQWCLHHYKKYSTESVKQEVRRMMNRIAAASEYSVYRTSDIRWYQKSYYEERLKPHVTTFHDQQLATWQANGSVGRKPQFLSSLHTVAKGRWENETAEFRQEVQEANAKDYEERVEAAKKENCSFVPSTPEEFQEALDNAPAILQSFSELLGERLGAVVSVLISLPVPKQGGAIEMRR